MLNPIVYTEKVISDFLRYQLTAYPLTDHNLYQQMRTLLNLETTAKPPSSKGHTSASAKALDKAPPSRALSKKAFCTPA